jgi:hypothetical protein
MIHWYAKMLKSIDLFSGIGGFAYALRNVCQPVAYYEIDSTCRDILHHNIENGNIPHATINTDVRTINTSTIIESHPMILTAGFPCQDVSILRRERKGLDGPKTSLVEHVWRILDAVPSISVVILENSPAIMKGGDIDKILARLKHARFEDVYWGIWSAGEVGARHCRRRWYCMATRGDVSNIVHTIANTLKPDVVHHSDPCRVLSKDGLTRDQIKYHMSKLHAIGNAIVPHQCTKAIHDMCTLSNQKHMLYSQIVSMPTSAVGKYIYNVCNDVIHQYVRVVGTEIESDLMMESDDKQIVLKKWPTPIASQTTQFRNAFKKRNVRIFHHAVFYEHRTRLEMGLSLADVKYADRSFMINPQFVLDMMGYPLDWMDYTQSPQSTQSTHSTS